MSFWTNEKTGRGFDRYGFRDRYGKACSLQKSSLATEDCVWLGIDDPEPSIMATQAPAHGIRTNQTTGWVPFPIPSEVSLTTRMHLTCEQAERIGLALIAFSQTGELPDL